MEKFEGLNRDDFSFLTELQENNNKAWFEQNRDRWEALRERMRLLCVELTPFVNDLDPDLETAAKTGRSLGRINRDTRFSKDKRPYKQNFDIIFFPREFKRTTAPGFAVGITPDQCYIGTWLSPGMKDFRDRYESNIDNHRDVFIAYLTKNDNFSDMHIGGESYAKPRIEGLPQPAYEWAQRKGFHMGTMMDADDVIKAGKKFIEVIEKTFIRLYPLYLFSSSVSLAADLENFKEKFK